MKYRRIPIEIEANQWWKNGDHPDDYTVEVGLDVSPALRMMQGWEGDVVRFYRHPDVNGSKIHHVCGRTWHEHGWIDNKEAPYVCPGDYVVTVMSDPIRYTVIHRKEFEDEYEKIVPQIITPNEARKKMGFDVFTVRVEEMDDH